MRERIQLPARFSRTSQNLPTRIQVPQMPLSVDESTVDPRVVYDLSDVDLTYVVDRDSSEGTMLHAFTAPHTAKEYIQSLSEDEEFPDYRAGHAGLAARYPAESARVASDFSGQVVEYWSKTGIQEGDSWAVFFDKTKGGWQRDDFRKVKRGTFGWGGDLNDKARALNAFMHAGWALWIYEHINQQGQRMLVRTNPRNFRADILNLGVYGFLNRASSQNAEWLG
jgi:hypothetical protein